MIRTFVIVSCLASGVMAAEPLPAPLSEQDYRPFNERAARIGQLLFYDKILSGNRNISCGTCHNHDRATTDGLSLGIGEGGVGLGADRRIPEGRDRPRKRVPRNANALFNLGHKSVSVMFHDGRVNDADSYERGFNSPVEEWLPLGLQSVLAVQALLPLTAEVEMAGEKQENDIAAAKNRRIDNVWPIVAARVAAIPEYVELFREAYPSVDGQGDIDAVHIANAIDDFINSEWRTVGSAFDRYLGGDTAALSDEQSRGLNLFYGKAGCADCHSGALLTDQEFHALALPPFGPGRIRAFDPYARDVGRMSETDRLEDAYRFRTPSLRNVSKTGPWGHNGAYASLEGIVRHHLDPLGALDRWDRSQLIMPADAEFAKTDFAIWEDGREMARLRSRVDIDLPALTDREIGDILAFLEALDEPASLKGRLGKPRLVPSGLPVD